MKANIKIETKLIRKTIVLNETTHKKALSYYIINALIKVHILGFCFEK